MAKIFTMTVFTKPDGFRDWDSEPSFVGKVIMSDDLRFIGFANECRRRKNQPIKYSYINGTATRMGDNRFALGFCRLGDGFKKHAYHIPKATFNSLSDGYFGCIESDEHNLDQFVRDGTIRIDFREYAYSDSALQEVRKEYEKLSGLPAHNEELLKHVRFFRSQAAMA